MCNQYVIKNILMCKEWFLNGCTHQKRALSSAGGMATGKEGQEMWDGSYGLFSYDDPNIYFIVQIGIEIKTVDPTL